MTIQRMREARSASLTSWPNGYGLQDPSAIPPPGMYSMQRAGVPVTIHALALDTPIATLDGWKTMGTLAVGDRVYAEDGSPTRVSHISETFVGKDCYRVRFADGAALIATGDHRWRVWDAKGGAVARARGDAWKVLSTAELISASSRCVSGRQNRFRVHCDGVVQSPTADLPIDPYIFGYWLGDGDLHAPALTVGHDDAEHVRVQIKEAGYRVVSERSKSSQWGSGLHIRFGIDAKHMDGAESRLKRLDVMRNPRTRAYGEKHIPSTYMLASPEQRRALLAGLLDSDGSISAQPVVTFAASSERLANDVHTLARSLGQRATIRPADGYFKVQWTPTFDPFRMARKSAKFVCRSVSVQGRRLDLMSVVAIEPVESVPARCIAVEHESHVFLAGEKFTPTHNTALQVDSVFTALRVLSNAVIKLGSPRAYTETLDAENRPYRVWLADQPAVLTNTWGPSMFQFDGTVRTVMSMGLFGEAFWYVLERDKMQYPTALEVLNPALVDIKRDGTIWYGAGADKVELNRENLVHIPFLAMPGAQRGLNSIEYAGVAFALALAAMEYGQRWFAQGASPSFLLSTEQKLGQPEIDRIAEKFMIEHSGLQAAHLPLVVDSGLKVEKISSTPDEAQYLKTLEYARRVIAAWFGLPTHLVGGEGDSGNVWGGTVEQQSIQMIAFTLSGYMVRLNEAYSSLLPTGQFAALDEEQLKTLDATSLAKLIQMERLAGVKTQNEIRVARFGLPPIKGGDVLLAPLNSNTSKSVGGVWAEEIADDLDIPDVVVA